MGGCAGRLPTVSVAPATAQITSPCYGSAAKSTGSSSFCACPRRPDSSRILSATSSATPPTPSLPKSRRGKAVSVKRALPCMEQPVQWSSHSASPWRHGLRRCCERLLKGVARQSELTRRGATHLPPCVIMPALPRAWAQAMRATNLGRCIGIHMHS
eukprot:scaffold2017_cov387-Prasinococcus_capsulatus_cf.AAC.7